MIGEKDENKNVPDDNTDKPVTSPQGAVSPDAPKIVVGSNTEDQFQAQPASSPVGLVDNGHRLLKTYVTIAFVILVLNTVLLSVTFIPIAGIFIALGASPIFAANGVLGLVSLFVVARALAKRLLVDKFKKFGITVLVLSVIAVLVSMPAFMVLKANHDETVKGQKMSQYYKQAEAAARSEATVAQATKLLNDCQVFGFYYTGQNGKDGAENAEATKTGILLYKMSASYDGTTTPASSDAGKYRMHIADRMIDTMVPLARKAQQTCGIQFWHDGSYEQWKNGVWYFKGQAASNGQAAKTVDDAVALLQSCAVDYFVGQTSSSYVPKDDSTKQWLSKAQQSSTGITILENSPKTYVFASVAQTTALQDKARQFRQACYDKKKLYISIDGWIETEYPVGTWTKVKQ